MNFLNAQNYELTSSSEAVALRMFSLTDIQPEPTDIGEILVKVRSVDCEVAGLCWLQVMTFNFLVKFGSLSSL